MNEASQGHGCGWEGGGAGQQSQQLKNLQIIHIGEVRFFTHEKNIL